MMVKNSCPKKDWIAYLHYKQPTFTANSPYDSKVVMGPDQIFLTLFGSGQVSHLWFGLDLENFP